jgi:pimeloyl-ACP methyl ester carboxylesterase
VPWARIVALVLAAGLLLGLAYLRFWYPAAAVSVPPGAHAGQLTLQPCTYSTEYGGYAADCGTLVVPEDRADPRSRLIALPVIRIRARSAHPLAPIFWLSGGPGTSNMKFPQASRLAARHDVVIVGYRGVDGSSVLACPEVIAALENSADFLTSTSMRAYAQALAACAHRLQADGVDLAGYTPAEQAADIEAARAALGYPRIDLLSESAGTRPAMIYAWRYPAHVSRSAMVGVNPPGHYLFSGTQVDQGIERYSALCAHDPSCRARTANLAASMRYTAAHMPGRWFFLPIHPGKVKVGTILGLTEATSAAAPESGPMTLDSWISAAHGDTSGMWLISMMAGLIVPKAFTWGEAASMVTADAHTAQRYFGSTTGRGSIIGNPQNELLWGDGRCGLCAWPANPGENQYTRVPNSTVPTLLIGGTLDFQTPPQNATTELLPHLPHGHQVILPGLGHARDFWHYEPAASTRLLTTFYATGRVDTSRYTPNTVRFTTPVTQDAIAEYLLATMLGLAALTIAALAWLALRVRNRGEAGRKTSITFRTVLAPFLGLGGWFLAALTVLTLFPTVSLASGLLAILAASAPIALGLYLAWTRRDRDTAAKIQGMLAATAGALAGGWFGYTATTGLAALLTTIIGAAAAGNLALIALDLYHQPPTRPATTTPPATHTAPPAPQLRSTARSPHPPPLASHPANTGPDSETPHGRHPMPSGPPASS